MSKETKAEGNEAHCETLQGKELRLCLSNWHDSNTKLRNLDRLGTSCCNLQD